MFPDTFAALQPDSHSDFALAHQGNKVPHGKLLDRPILIIGCNRSGTTLLFRNLAEHPTTWSLYEESQDIYYRHYPLDPTDGDRIAEPPSAEVAAAITNALYLQAHNKEIFCDHPVLKFVSRKLLQRPLNRLYKRAPIRLVDKTPANCLRVPFLAKLFPDALLIYSVRRAEDVISSMMQGWKRWSHTGSGVWEFSKWHYLAPPGWGEWKHRPLEEICAFQWVESNRIAWEDLNRHCQGRFLLTRHEEAIANPAKTYQKIREFCELPVSPFFERQISQTAGRMFTHGGTMPRPGKWKELHPREVESVRHLFQPLVDELYPKAAVS